MKFSTIHGFVLNAWPRKNQLNQKWRLLLNPLLQPYQWRKENEEESPKQQYNNQPILLNHQRRKSNIAILNVKLKMILRWSAVILVMNGSITSVVVFKRVISMKMNHGFVEIVFQTANPSKKVKSRNANVEYNDDTIHILYLDESLSFLIVLMVYDYL